MTISASQITGLILCGGEGRRMGGVDKGLLSFHGKALVDIAIARLTTQVGQIMISANRNIQQYEQRNCAVLKDPGFQDDGPNYEGPLAGILAGLRSCTTEWLAIVPCDCPQFPLDFVSRLSLASEAHNTSSYVQGHPTFALLRKSELPKLEHYLQHGKRKLGDWLEEIKATPVPFELEDAFRNLNSPEDLS
jgi:molybdenum cofactor guanylyltransferase